MQTIENQHLRPIALTLLILFATCLIAPACTDLLADCLRLAGEKMHEIEYQQEGYLTGF